MEKEELNKQIEKLQNELNEKDKKINELIKENELLKNQINKELYKLEYEQNERCDNDFINDFDFDSDIEYYFEKYNISYNELQSYEIKCSKKYEKKYFNIYQLIFDDKFKEFDMSNIIECLLEDYYDYKYDGIHNKKETLIIIEKEKNKEYLLCIQDDPFYGYYYEFFNSYASDVYTFINRLCNIHVYYYLNSIIIYNDNNNINNHKYNILYYNDEETEEFINNFKGLFKIIDDYYKDK